MHVVYDCVCQVFQGKTVKVPVVTGPEGVAEFKRTVCKLFNLPAGTDFEVTFECKSPVFGGSGCTHRMLSSHARVAVRAHGYKAHTVYAISHPPWLPVTLTTTAHPPMTII